MITVPFVKLTVTGQSTGLLMFSQRQTYSLLQTVHLVMRLRLKPTNG